MTKLLEQAVETVRGLPAADQDTIAQAMLGLAGLGSAEDIDPEHLEDVLAGLAEIESGELASPEEVEAAFRSFER
ncbi:hypothetical protein ABEV34_08970 [Methylorubrum rhodesianum]|jgi:predicted transcriptional regulator|uniref:Uncharacterized protein n=1 Tax=Methylorubrum rhodesianum TaxID=29427 RepID=A0ABU9ZB15_9HYPH|nr:MULTISPECIES: hypothetical protein [Methylorubrum]MBY0139764.1 hypothetical protein [Methylorubrum populi]MRI54722.1 hypothetical protein [Methylobacterium sp. DB1607]MBB5763133.1 putative transcriptional regulator [Methylorubrum rhodesianum]MBI1689138.1 hypothetical protein [Methylorubrum sp. DB1722]MBK3403406.1 hypothetical protein [Methylorubrum rhodesianum]